MSEKTGKPYENLTQVVFQMILGQKEFPNIKVEHDISLQGKTARHQIDVYWKFEVGSVPHEVIVQAKDWAKPIDQLHLLAFKQILDDLPGQPKGIFVTRSGYQSGAKEFALAHGILIYELREIEILPPLQITAGGWARVCLIPMPLHGLVTTSEDSVDGVHAVAYGFAWETFTPKYTEIKFMVSADWFKEEYPDLRFETLQGMTLASVQPHERFFFDISGANIGNLGTVTAEIIKELQKDFVDKKQVTHVFDPPVFITTLDSHIKSILVSSVSINVEIERTQCVRRLRMSNISQLVLHQLNSDQKWWFAATPNVITKILKPHAERLTSAERKRLETSSEDDVVTQS